MTYPCSVQGSARGRDRGPVRFLIPGFELKEKRKKIFFSSQKINEILSKKKQDLGFQKSIPGPKIASDKTLPI